MTEKSNKKSIPSRETTLPTEKEDGMPVFKRTQKYLKGEEKRDDQAEYLLNLSEAIRSITASAQIEETFTRMSMNYFKADRCYYGIVEGRDFIIQKDVRKKGLPSVSGVYPLGSFDLLRKGLEKGVPFVVHNAYTSVILEKALKDYCLRLKVISFIDVPLIKKGKMVAVLCLVQSTPRNWTAKEVALISETTEHAWVAIERSRAEEALRKKEMQQSFLLELSDAMRPLKDSLTVQEAACRHLGKQLGVNGVGYGELQSDNQTVRIERDWTSPGSLSVAGFYDLDEFGETFNRSLRKGKVLIIEDFSKDRKISSDSYENLWAKMEARAAVLYPLFKQNKFVAALFIRQQQPREWQKEEVALVKETGERTWEAVHRAKAEEALRNAAEKDAFRVKLNEALRPLTSAAEIRSTALHLLGERLQVDRLLYGNILADNKSIKMSGGYTKKGVEKMERVFPLTLFGPAVSILRKGKSFVMPDIHTEPRFSEEEKQNLKAFGIISAIGCPLIKNGRWKAKIGAHDGKPRKWEPAEVEMVQETMERIWDATERLNAEEKLKKSEEKLRIALESAIDYAIITIDLHRKIESWSLGAQNIFGYKEKEVLGKPIDLVFTPEDVKAGLPQRETEIAKKEGRANDERWRLRKDGSKFFMSGVMHPIYNPKLVGFVKSGRDMTEQKLLEQQKDEFIGIASHELKTPVTSIKIYAQIAGDRFEKIKDLEGIHLLNKLNSQIDRLINLINSLLDTTRISTGQLKLDFTNLNINLLLEEILKELETTYTDHQFKLETEPVNPMPADKERLRQVLINLLSNAVKYSPKETLITISCKNKGTEVEVGVQDEGYGITKEDQENLFTRFYRTNDQKAKKFSGMGLGLYISSQIIKRHGGKFHVSSKPDDGSFFSFTLPYKKPVL